MKYMSLKNMTEEEKKARKRKQKAEAQKRYYKKNKEYYKNYSKNWSMQKQKEIERLNNIINELEKGFEEELKNLNYSEDKIYAQGIHDTIISHKYKLQELKGE